MVFRTKLYINGNITIYKPTTKKQHTQYKHSHGTITWLTNSETEYFCYLEQIVDSVETHGLDGTGCNLSSEMPIC